MNNDSLEKLIKTDIPLSDQCFSLSSNGKTREFVQTPIHVQQRPNPRVCTNANAGDAKGNHHQAYWYQDIDKKRQVFQPKKSCKENVETYKFLCIANYANNKAAWKRSREVLSILISSGHCGAATRWCVTLLIFALKKTLILLAGRAEPFILDFLANCFWHGSKPVVRSVSKGGRISSNSFDLIKPKPETLIVS